MNQADPRSGQAEDAATAKAEAEAAKAKADAEKAEADARQAQANARKTEQEIADHDAPAAARQREAEARKKTAEADKDAAAAQRAQYAALIPDLSTVKESTLEVKEGPPLWASFLVGRAVKAAARSIASKLEVLKNETCRFLVTSDPDLATADAFYEDVKTGLDELVTAADKLLQETAPETVGTAAFVPPKVALQAAGAVASAVPAVLSLLSARRTVSASAVTANDLMAAAAVAGSMKVQTNAWSVAHDDFRLLPGMGVYRLSGDVATRRQLLVARKIELGNKKSGAETNLARAKSELETLKKLKPVPPDLQQQLEATNERIYGFQNQLSDIELRAGLIDSLLTATDAFTSSIRAVPAGARRSALASAALHEQLHDDGDSSYTHVLLVKTQSGQVQQVLDNRPLWWHDRFSTAVDVSITYMLIDVEESNIVAAGTETAIRSARGKIGDRPTID